jgi:hypothetical protein
MSEHPFVAVQAPNKRGRWLGPTSSVRHNAAKHQWKKWRGPQSTGGKFQAGVTSRHISRADAKGIPATTCNGDGRAEQLNTGSDFKVQPSASQDTLENNQLQRPLCTQIDVDDPYPSTLARDIVVPLVQFHQSVIASSFPSADYSRTTSIVDESTITMLEDPTTFHAVLYASTALHVSQRFSPSLESVTKFARAAEECQAMAIAGGQRLLNNILKHEQDPDLREVICLLAFMLCVSVQPCARSGSSTLVPGPRQAPFQQLDLYLVHMSPRLNLVQTTNTKRLVDLSGGLAQLPSCVSLVLCMWVTPCSLASFKQLMRGSISLVVATRQQVRPDWPPQPLNLDFEEFITSSASKTWAIRRKPLRLIMTVRELPEFLSRPLLEVIDNVWFCVTLTITLCHRIDPSIHTSYLTDARRWTQHGVLSLPRHLQKGDHNSSMSSELNLYEAIRLAINIFSLIAVFPLATPISPFQQLSTDLLTHLQTKPLHLGQDYNHDHLQLWVLAMGALSSIGIPENRKRFVSMFRNLAHRLRLQRWQDVHALLEDNFFWFSDVSDFDGQVLWLEAQVHESVP